VIWKIGKIEHLRSKIFSSQKTAYFNKTADFSSLKTLNGVGWQYHPGPPRDIAEAQCRATLP